MIKGHVSLGSLRVRHDRLLFEALLGTESTGSGESDDPVELALARIRQLSAHEVGHTLGLAHNFAASTYAGRASVMDYPAPYVRLGVAGGLDVSDAYAVRIGTWDRFAIRWAYSEFPADIESQRLEAMIGESIDDGLVFLTDHDARPPGAAEPRASLWDNGSDPVEALRELIAVRARAIERFGERNVREGTPLSVLQEVFVPLYLHHRYQLEATAKVVGGLQYDYAVRGDDAGRAVPIGAREQREALAVLISTLHPEFLDIPEPTLRVLLPRSFGTAGDDPERFRAATAPAFDALGAAATSADLTLRALLQRERLARVVDQHRRDPQLPSTEEVLGELLSGLFPLRESEPRRRALQQIVQRVLVDRMVELAANDQTSTLVRAATEGQLEELRDRLEDAESSAGGLDAHSRSLARDLRIYLEERRWEGPSGWRAAPAPPGSPIGALQWWGGGCAWDR
jgi:hypothetical protein